MGSRKGVMSCSFNHLDFGHSILSFDWAQDGELVEPFRVSDFVLRIYGFSRDSPYAPLWGACSKLRPWGGDSVLWKELIVRRKKRHPYYEMACVAISGRLLTIELRGYSFLKRSAASRLDRKQKSNGETEASRSSMLSKLNTSLWLLP